MAIRKRPPLYSSSERDQNRLSEIMELEQTRKQAERLRGIVKELVDRFDTRELMKDEMMIRARKARFEGIG